MRVISVVLMLPLAACAGTPANSSAPVEAEPILVLTSEGLQGLPVETKINAIEIQRAYPELDVEGSAYGKRYAVRLEGETLVLIEPTGEVGYRAKLLSNKTTGPRSIRVGDPFSEVAALSDLQCRRGSGEWASEVYCTSSSTEHIVYGFDADNIETGDCLAECVVTDTSGLERAKVRMIDWQL